MGKNKAIFLDRDGTINVDVHYLDTPNNFKMYPGVGLGVKRLQDAGFKIIVITNQSGIARGYFTLETLERIHEKMLKEFEEYDVHVDGIYFCPHRPDDNCNCRKPNTGMFEKAIIEYNIDTKISFMIGDKILDVAAGRRVGIQTILIPEPDMREDTLKQKDSWDITPDYLAKDFMDAVERILKSRL